MKLRIEISDDAEEEVIIRCKSVSERIRRIENALGAAIGESSEMVLTLGDAEHFVSIGSVLFFETDDGRVSAHTVNKMYYTDRKLYELEQTLPRTFVRVSKSCIVNSAKVSALSRGITGLAEAMFNGCAKKAAVSRMYYKILKQTIEETRFSK